MELIHCLGSRCGRAVTTKLNSACAGSIALERTGLEMPSIEPVGIDGAWAVTSPVHRDRRGSIHESFRSADLADVLGYQPQISQADSSVSRQGVIRGIHFAEVPPGQAKYIWCVSGEVMDVVVDIRVGSPTYGRWSTVTLDDESRRAIFISEGLGHAFAVLSNMATLIYLCSTPYNPAIEHTINPLDPAIGIAWPTVSQPILSDKDIAGPPLDEVARAGLLPSQRSCDVHVAGLRRSGHACRGVTRTDRAR
jgi:dTDP-4-dehydrorhamnose 3,5-epimerase